MKDLHLRALEPRDEMIVRAMHDDFMREEKFEFLLFDGDWNAVLNQSRKLARGIDLPEGYVPAEFLLAEVAGEVVGRVSIRYELNDYLRRYGGTSVMRWQRSTDGKDMRPRYCVNRLIFWPGAV